MSLLKNKKSIIGLSITGILAYIIFVIASTPARILPGQLAKYNSPINLAGVSGTLWNGKAEQLYYHGLPLGKITWSIPAYTLLLGKLTLDIKLNGEQLIANGRISYSLDSKLQLQNTQLTLNIAQLAEIFKYPALADGNLRANITLLEYTTKQNTAEPNTTAPNKTPTDKADKKEKGRTAAANSAPMTTKPLKLPLIDAQLQLENLSIRSMNIEKLGSYTIALNSTPANHAQTIIARVIKSQGALEISGNAQISQDHLYKTNLSLKPDSNAPEAIKGMLTMLGQPDAKNHHRINKTGQIDSILIFFQ